MSFLLVLINLNNNVKDIVLSIYYVSFKFNKKTKF